MRYLSLFSGMEAAHLAWAPLGWECAGVAEIDPAACALLHHRLPNVPNLGSVTDITDAQVRALGPLDVVIGGSPCQDLSVAGKRAGLAGARSGLFHHQLRIFDAARFVCGARWLVWENVPGAFSSNAGRDFAVVVGALAGSELAVPQDGWGNEGVALGPRGLVEWSVLDAQWFGVAQRRRRVFAVLDTGDWAGRPPILLEPDGLRGDSAPRREAGESVAGTLACRPDRGSSKDERNGLIAGTLQANGKAAGSATQQDAESGLLVVARAFGGGANCQSTDVATALHAHPGGSRLDFQTETFLVQEVAHTLRSGWLDASEDGTGRGPPLVPVHTVCLGSDPIFNRDLAMPQTCRNGDPGVVQQGMRVRRLIPREAERLQGALDNWTLVPNGAGKPMADGPRYKMLGNSFAIPVVRWIGARIQMAHTWDQTVPEVA